MWELVFDVIFWMGGLMNVTLGWSFDNCCHTTAKCVKTYNLVLGAFFVVKLI